MSEASDKVGKVPEDIAKRRAVQAALQIPDPHNSVHNIDEEVLCKMVELYDTDVLHGDTITTTINSSILATDPSNHDLDVPHGNQAHNLERTTSHDLTKPIHGNTKGNTHHD